jgi:hypothetical protein
MINCFASPLCEIITQSCRGGSKLLMTKYHVCDKVETFLTVNPLPEELARELSGKCSWFGMFSDLDSHFRPRTFH